MSKKHEGKSLDSFRKHTQIVISSLMAETGMARQIYYNDREREEIDSGHKQAYLAAIREKFFEKVKKNMHSGEGEFTPDMITEHMVFGFTPPRQKDVMKENMIRDMISQNDFLRQQIEVKDAQLEQANRQNLNLTQALLNFSQKDLSKNGTI